MHLCAYSKSEVLRAQVLSDCPLGLNATQAKQCECKTRAFIHVGRRDPLRVKRCTFPLTWQGKPVADPDGMRLYTLTKLRTAKGEL